MTVCTNGLRRYLAWFGVLLGWKAYLLGLILGPNGAFMRNSDLDVVGIHGYWDLVF